MSSGFPPAVIQFATSAAETAVREALDEVFVTMWKGRRTDEPGAWATYRTGSRAALRLWGVHSERGARRFPLIIRADVGEDAGHRVVRLIVDGDEGPYLIYPERAHRKWRGNVERLFEQVQHLLAQPETRP